MKGFCDSALSQQLATETMMAGKEIAVKKYVVRLSEDERNQLNELIRKGKSSAQRLTKARILLKADVSEAGEGGAIAGSSKRWRPARRRSIGPANNGLRRALRRC